MRRNATHGLTLVCTVLLCASLAVPAMSLASDDKPSVVVQHVDASEYPAVTLSVSLPAELLAAGVEPEFVVNENGKRVKTLSVSGADEQSEPTDVVLVIDTSGSMGGAALESAKQAADAFFAGLSAPNRVAVVAFSTQARVVQGFSEDDAALSSAVGELKASGETALYDALLAASDLISASPHEHGAIVVLSDGGDTVSRSQFDAMLTRLTDRSVPVFAVALNSAEADPAALNTIAASTSGRVMNVTHIAELPASFEGIARQIQGRYLVVYESLMPATVDLEIDVAANAGDVDALGSVIVRNPGFVARAALDPWEPARSPAANYFDLGAAVLLSFVSVALLAGGLLLLTIKPPNALKHLTYYDQLHGTSDELPTIDDATGATLADRMVDAVGYVAGRSGMTAMVHQWLARAGLPLRPKEYITGHITFVVLVSGLFQLLVGNFVLSIVVVLLTTAVPMLFIQHLANRRSKAFEEQLPDVLNLIAGSVRSGWGMQQAVDMVVQEMVPPASIEFRRVQTEARLGLPVEDAMMSMAERLDSSDFRWAVSAITIQREVGGNLAEVLDIVAETIRERAALRRHVDSLTAEGKLSASVLIALPFLEVFVLMLVNPTYMSQMFDTSVGLVVAAFGMALLVIGAVWLRRAISVEV
ncbi:MAG: VWA domain-containing protein [Actinomycetota bacterium]|nr:VWA domain-containing protein [Actinomycetota bacterium]